MSDTLTRTLQQLREELGEIANVLQSERLRTCALAAEHACRLLEKEQRSIRSLHLRFLSDDLVSQIKEATQAAEAIATTPSSCGEAGPTSRLPCSGWHGRKTDETTD